MAGQMDLMCALRCSLEEAAQADSSAQAQGPCLHSPIRKRRCIVWSPYHVTIGPSHMAIIQLLTLCLYEMWKRVVGKTDKALEAQRLRHERAGHHQAAGYCPNIFKVCEFAGQSLYCASNRTTLQQELHMHLYYTRSLQGSPCAY